MACIGGGSSAALPHFRSQDSGQGTITLTISGAGEDNAATGDLDIRGKLTVEGK
jgi:hypothetical protein